jgi:hypothetical protein
MIGVKGPRGYVEHLRYQQLVRAPVSQSLSDRDHSPDRRRRDPPHDLFRDQ